MNVLMKKNIYENSLAVVFLKKLVSSYNSLNAVLGENFKLSSFFFLTTQLKNKFKIIFDKSSVIKFLKFESRRNIEFLDSSKATNFLKFFMEKRKKKSKRYIEGSSIFNFGKTLDLIDNVFLNRAGVIVIFSTLTNIFLMIILRKNIDIFGITLRGFLLLIGAFLSMKSIIFKDLKKSSYILGFFTRRR